MFIYLTQTNLYSARIFLDRNINILWSPCTSCRAWYHLLHLSIFGCKAAGNNYRYFTAWLAHTAPYSVLTSFF